MTALLERERELAELEALVAEARAGTGRLVAIEGQAGLGKTRLLQAAREAAAQAGLHGFAGRATELERDFPFALVRQLFEPQLASLPSVERDALFEGAQAARGALGLADDGAQEGHDTFAVLHGLYWLAAALAERQPLLLAIDDAHWADAASIDFLRFLLPRLEELPLLVVVTCRPDDPEAAGGLAQVVSDMVTRRLTPSALSLEAATALLAEELSRSPEAAFAAACHEVSGGNPFLLCELARTLAAGGVRPAAEEAQAVRELAPERVTRMVLLRVGRLSQEAQALARALLILGDDNDLRLVTRLAGLDTSVALAGADELRRAAILDAGVRLRFIHPLVRTALYSELPAGERADAHARAAALLCEDGASPMQLAAHLVATEPRGERETVETLVEAASRALASGAPQSTVAYLLRALREPPPEDLRADVLGPLIMASVRAADHSVYPAIEADVLAELERKPTLRSDWAARLTGWMIFNGRPDQAVALLERAIEVAASADDDERAFRLEAQLSTLVQRSPAETRTRLAPYRDQIEPDSEDGRIAAAFDAQWAAVTGSATEAVALARHVLAHAGRVFDDTPTIPAGAVAVAALIGADKLDEAQRAAEWALAIARQRNGMPDLAAASAIRGAVAAACGDMVAAEGDFRQALDTARLAGLMVVVPVFTGVLIEVLIQRDELAAARTELDATGLATGVIPDIVVFATLLFARGRLRAAEGRTAEAAEDLLELQRRMERAGLGESPLLPARAHAARALAAVGELTQACELAEADLARARQWGAPTAISRALRALSTATAGPQGIELLEQAAQLLDGSPARLERAQALSELGAALRRQNRRVDAREPLRQALELARRCGAARLAKQTHDELQACGEKVRRYTPIGVESLTPSERRVAEMAAAGMTNRQIAQTLFLTVKTIETHLSACYDKLGIRSRRGLGEALGE